MNICQIQVPIYNKVFPISVRPSNPNSHIFPSRLQHAPASQNFLSYVLEIDTLTLLFKTRKLWRPSNKKDYNDYKIHIVVNEMCRNVKCEERTSGDDESAGDYVSKECKGLSICIYTKHASSMLDRKVARPQQGGKRLVLEKTSAPAIDL